MESDQIHTSTDLAHHLAEMRPFDLVDEMALDAIERGANRILEEVGVRLKDHGETLEVLKQIGGKVEGDLVRLDGTHLREIIRKHAPRTFRVQARNPSRDTIIGETGTRSFTPIYGAPDVLLESGRRVKGTRAIYEELTTIAHHFPGITNTGHMTCVLEDTPEPRRPLEMLRMHLTHSDKPFMGSIASPKAMTEYSALTAAAFGRSPDKGSCNLLHLLNASPPLTYWENPLRCLKAIAECGEGAIVSSYMMMGATSPVTVAGTLIQGYAEALCGLALAQLWRPGTPVVMGILAWAFDMRSMIPRFDDPASYMVQYHAAALARRLGIPSRGDGAVTSAKIADAQAGYEGTHSLNASIGSGAHFILHAAGWLAQARCVSIDKLRRDAELISRQYFPGAEACEPPEPPDPAISAEIQTRLSAL